jgi:S1-C subfamily serine protease
MKALLKAMSGIVWFVVLAGCALPPEGWVPLAGPAPSGAQNLVGGTGFLVRGGAVVTAWHVVRSCKAIRVTAASGAFQAASAMVAALPTRPSVDLALLRLDPAIASRTEGVHFRDIWPTPEAWQAAGERGLPKPAAAGDLAVLGYPGATPSLEPVVTPISQISAARLKNVAWQGDAFAVFGDIARGDSGAPMVDHSGRVVGVMLAVAFKEDELRKDGIKGSVGFALPTHEVASFLAEAGSPAAVDQRATADGSVEDFKRNLVRVFCYR